MSNTNPVEQSVISIGNENFDVNKSLLSYSHNIINLILKKNSFSDILWGVR